MKSLLIIMSLTLALGLNAKDYEKEAKKLMEKKVSERKTVICSPDGRDGSLTPAQALAKLKNGGKLVLLPGSYSGIIEISKKGIIIEGIIGKKSNAFLIITGKGCIIRNCWFGSLELREDTAVVNSICNYVTCIYKKKEVEFYNSMIGWIQSGGETEFLFANCTIRNVRNECIGSLGIAKIEIFDSILYSKLLIFNLDSSGRKKCELTLKNNLMYAEGSLGGVRINRTSGAQAPEFVITDIKDLKKICKLKKSSNNKYAPIEFKNSLEANERYKDKPLMMYSLKPKHSLLLEEVEQGVKLSKEWFENLEK